MSVKGYKWSSIRIVNQKMKKTGFLFRIYGYKRKQMYGKSENKNIACEANFSV